MNPLGLLPSRQWPRAVTSSPVTPVGWAEVVDHRRTGLTVRANDAQSIVWAVDQLFSDPVQAQAMRARGLQEVMRSYNWVTIAASTEDTYRAVLAQRQDVNW